MATITYDQRNPGVTCEGLVDGTNDITFIIENFDTNTPGHIQLAQFDEYGKKHNCGSVRFNDSSDKIWCGYQIESNYSLKVRFVPRESDDPKVNITWPESPSENSYPITLVWSGSEWTGSFSLPASGLTIADDTVSLSSSAQRIHIKVQDASGSDGSRHIWFLEIDDLNPDIATILKSSILDTTTDVGHLDINYDSEIPGALWNLGVIIMKDTGVSAWYEVWSSNQ